MNQPWVLVILNGRLKLNIRVRIIVQIINGIKQMLEAKVREVEVCRLPFYVIAGTNVSL